MNIGTNKMLGAVLGLALLASGMAAAEGSRVRSKRSCPDRCAKNLKECTQVCKESAGPAGAPTCIQACQQAEQKCAIKCG
ncbi:hypothetical protein SAMN05444354_103374 [Stigmatella aurantiaca]|uniref:Uncharacterized protein n=1 Tax=Stigmatella aurantiaca TaxID=41 RepID=A0A1H7M005_STIAU|nr:hypothetical protein [Stigmatella aurantiaca]SEL03897.1 hypothetical protein SAMN05444354_103374 [Stigmatella aurantiaca]